MAIGSRAFRLFKAKVKFANLIPQSLHLKGQPLAKVEEGIKSEGPILGSPPFKKGGTWGKCFRVATGTGFGLKVLTGGIYFTKQFHGKKG